jgi:prepilin-type processing-associated H-X9-DG protein
MTLPVVAEPQPLRQRHWISLSMRVLVIPISNREMPVLWLDGHSTILEQIMNISRGGSAYARDKKEPGL